MSAPVAPIYDRIHDLRDFSGSPVDGQPLVYSSSGTNFATADVGPWVRPETYGALGNGTNDDTIALRAAIAAARHVLLKAGKTYLYSGRLTLGSNQHFYGFGATLKRRNQLATTTSTTITANVTTSVTVASATGFAVGMDVVFSQGAQSGLVILTSLSSNLCRITAIVGNVLTLSTAPDTSFTGTTDVHLAFVGIECVGGNRVDGVNFDGNRANWAWSHWAVVTEILTSGDYNSIKDCGMSNAAGEGITIHGNHNTVDHCHGTNFTGNAVHFSGAVHPTVDNCAFDTGNLGTSNGSIGHQDGCIIWSNSISDATVTRNYISAFIAGFGGIDSSDNSDCTITGNTVRSCTSYGLLVAGAPANLTVADNRFYSCGTAGAVDGGLYLNNASGLGIKITNNLFSACSVKITGTVFAEIKGNTILNGDMTLSGNSDSQFEDNKVYLGNTTVTTPAIALNNLTRCDVNENKVYITVTNKACIAFVGANSPYCTINRNTLTGGSQGIAVSFTGMTDLAVCENVVRNSKSGLFIDASGTLTGLIASRNRLIQSTGVSSAFIGIKLASSGVRLIDNEISSETPGTGNWGILVQATASNNLIVGNFVRGTFTQKDIEVISGASTNTLAYNSSAVAIVDAGTSTVLTGNRTEGT